MSLIGIPGKCKVLLHTELFACCVRGLRGLVFFKPVIIEPRRQSNKKSDAGNDLAFEMRLETSLLRELSAGKYGQCCWRQMSPYFRTLGFHHVRVITHNSEFDTSILRSPPAPPPFPLYVSLNFILVMGAIVVSE